MCCLNLTVRVLEQLDDLGVAVLPGEGQRRVTILILDVPVGSGFEEDAEKQIVKGATEEQGRP